MAILKHRPHLLLHQFLLPILRLSQVYWVLIFLIFLVTSFSIITEFQTKNNNYVNRIVAMLILPFSSDLCYGSSCLLPHTSMESFHRVHSINLDTFCIDQVTIESEGKLLAAIFYNCIPKHLHGNLWSFAGNFLLK